MSNKIVIEEIRQFENTIQTKIIAIITQSPREVYENHKLSLSEIANISDIIIKEAMLTKCRYRLDMKLLDKEDDNIYLQECERMMRGNKPSPIYETIDDFLRKYKFDLPKIIEDLKQYNIKNGRNNPLK